MKSIIAITAAALVTLTAGHAAAQTDAPLKATVSYADLDLSRAGGREALEHRVQAAITRVCADEPSPVDLTRTRIYRMCREQAWAGAKQQLAAVFGGAKFAEATIQIGPGKR
ncbi:MAG: UrcA family protein [Phenylobacterium sp.]